MRPKPMVEQNETYLGDGLYASFDGFMIVLRAPRAEGDHWVGLEPNVYNALTEFVAGLPKRKPNEPDQRD